MRSLILDQYWKIAGPDQTATRLLCRELNIPESIANFLVLRGITSPDQAATHLSPRLVTLSDPFVMNDMEAAVMRMVAAIKKRERIGIFGDYDADGVTASALLYLFLQEIGVACDVYLPHRENEGYGLSKTGLETLARKGCELIITVDCGITAVDEVEHISKAGIDVIITDHHVPGGKLPRATAVLDPKRADCNFPFKELAGVGVAFSLVRAIRSRLHSIGFFSDSPPPNLKKYLDLVALGTISDVVPLLDENRILVKFGLDEVSRGARPGIKALKQISSLKDTVNATDMAFRMGPRINAAGRMAHALTAFELLTCPHEDEALKIASELHRLNNERQSEERFILKEASKQIEKAGTQPAYVLAEENWRPGVVGIVASRLTEKVSRPVILLAVKGDEAVGSGRSPEALDLHALLSSCSHLLERFGGHKAAAGMKLSRGKIDPFREALCNATKERLASVDLTPCLHIDARVTVEQLAAPAFHEFYQRLAPFGAGYRPPAFVVHGFSVRDTRIVGKGHLKVILDSRQHHNGSAISGIEIVGWGHGDKKDLPWEELEVACEPGINEWNGRRTLQLRLMDARQGL